MVRVLITGFKHSGTTLLHQLLNQHPQVERIENETGYVELDDAKKWLKIQSKQTDKVWGEKLPWGTRKNDLKAKRPIAFSKRWLRVFGNKARIVHIVRHPLDVSLSRYPLTGLINNLTIDKKMYKFATTTVPIFIDFINNSSKSKSIVYEELVTNPELHIKNLLTFLKLDAKPKTVKQIIEMKSLRFGCINPERAYAFEKKGLKSDFDYKKMIEEINKKL